MKDVARGSVDAGRQITAGGQACDLYAPADYEDIDVFMKPAGYANFNIVFAQGKMVLAYSASSVAEKKLPPIADPNSQPFNPPTSIPNATAKWYENLMMPGVKVGGGNPFLDPGAYRTFMIFQLTEAYYKVPNLYNDLLEHLVIPGADPSGPALGKRFDYQFMYEHGAQVMASKNPDFRYVNVPDEINMSDPAKNAYYREHALMVLPGLRYPQQRAVRTGYRHQGSLGYHLDEERSKPGERDQVSTAAAQSDGDRDAERKGACADFAGAREPSGFPQASRITAASGQDNGKIGSRIGRLCTPAASAA